MNKINLKELREEADDAIKLFEAGWDWEEVGHVCSYQTILTLIECVERMRETMKSCGYYLPDDTNRAKQALAFVEERLE